MIPTLSVQAVPGLPLIAKGDDLAGLIVAAIRAASIEIRDRDVIVVAQKVVSKAEGRTVHLVGVTPGDEARALSDKTGKDAALAELILAEAEEVMRAVPGVVITRHRTGHVLANAGIDASNVAVPEAGAVLLWPIDPDASAQRLREAIEAGFGVQVAVVVSDSLGRAWRHGTIGTAIGVSGMNPVRDRRGERDLFGRELQATEIAVADEIAAAASLVTGEGSEGTPVAIVRGAWFEPSTSHGARDLLRPLAQDLFR